MRTQPIKTLMAFIIISIVISSIHGIERGSYISTENGKEYFTLSTSGHLAQLVLDSVDHLGVIRAAKDLQKDIENVTGTKPDMLFSTKITHNEIVIIGTLGKSAIVDNLVKDKKLDTAGLSGRWETFIIQVLENPLPGIEKALVIAGSDKRGTIYGIYDLSAQIGVSPWYYWADVPIKKQSNIFVMPGRYTLGEPAVKYRGIFINDEVPALSGWTHEKFGGFNHLLYEKVFELLLRLKANYMWPAMWGNAFNEDDTINPVLADQYGIVMGTSHHEPMLRAQQEWKRHGSGKWSYDSNQKVLKEFWTQGIRNMKDHESIVTIGMHGDGDEPMSEQSNIALLERIVSDQRKILTDVTGKDPAAIPQLWALYKEVQDYYDKGMRVPDDVTLLLCDDNWGNIRKLPNLAEKPLKGGYGIYYHYDYVGGPRNYKWLNTNPIPRIWEQMNLAHEYGANKIWIVNVGDIKQMEFPIEFFLDYAWAPEKIKAEDLNDYTRMWTKTQFGTEFTNEIADIISKYLKYNSRRKPELLSPETYSLVNFNEAENIVAEYNKLCSDAENIYNKIAPEYKDAYYQLVLYPVKACANLNEMLVTIGKNRMYSKQGRSETNDLAKKAKELFKRDAELSLYYNKNLANGKWNHMMDQTHIGYTYWQQPNKNSMPEVKKISISKDAEMGIALEGTDAWWPNEKGDAIMPTFDKFNQKEHYFEIYNRGTNPFDYDVKSPVTWLQIIPNHGKVIKGQRIIVNIDWEKAPNGKQQLPITIFGPNKSSIVVKADIDNHDILKANKLTGFIESDGFASIEAIHFSKEVSTSSVTWQIIPGLGRTLSAVTPFPVIIKSQEISLNSPRLEYNIYFMDSGEIKVSAFISPTLSFNNSNGLRYAISFDNETPQTINIHEDKSLKAWENSVSNNIKILSSSHKFSNSGLHVLKFWMVDPGIVLQKLVVSTIEIKPSYLGPPESYYKQNTEK